MSYRKMRKQDLWEIYRRRRAGQSLSWISANERRDRKTVREYLRGLEQLGLKPGEKDVSRDEFFGRVEELLPKSAKRPAAGREELLRYKEELGELINRKKEPLKPKTAFEVVKRKHELGMSYETFKRFAREQGLSRRKGPGMIRIELPPGLQTQLDYGKMGTLCEGSSGANRVVWAFCGVLSHSRLPHVEFVWTQKQESFVGSVVKMWEFYGGCTELISVDNLKSGVIKPDLWDPQINRALAEAAEHYGVFVDPCRVARSTDKGKVERLVPVVRELFRMLKALHPSADLAELNEHARRWCREEYGQREHGTTGIAPMEAFEQEHPTLIPLPAERFCVPVWKQVNVHPGDQFLIFDNKRFSLPALWKGRKVWARYADALLRLYDDEQHLIRQYVTREGKRIYWVPEDFPEEVREMMDGGYPAWIVRKGGEYGLAARELLRSVLRPHAYLNARRARGMLRIMEDHCRCSYFEEVCLRARRRVVTLPSTLKRMLEAAAQQGKPQQQLPLSPLGAQMVRDVQYYTN